MRSIGVKLILAFLAVGLTGVGVIALLAGRATETEFRQFIFGDIIRKNNIAFNV